VRIMYWDLVIHEGVDTLSEKGLTQTRGTKQLFHNRPDGFLGESNWPRRAAKGRKLHRLQRMRKKHEGKLRGAKRKAGVSTESEYNGCNSIRVSQGILSFAGEKGKAVGRLVGYTQKKSRSDKQMYRGPWPIEERRGSWSKRVGAGAESASGTRKWEPTQAPAL